MAERVVACIVLPGDKTLAGDHRLMATGINSCNLNYFIILAVLEKFLWITSGSVHGLWNMENSMERILANKYLTKSMVVDWWMMFLFLISLIFWY